MSLRSMARCPRGMRAALALAPLLLAACAPFPVEEVPEPDARQPVPRAEPALEQPRVMPPPVAESAPRPPQQPAPEVIPQSPPSYHPAGEALLEQARREAMLGNMAAAGSTLERALRIDSANPWTWIELGYLRLEAGQDPAAESMARKALSLATRDMKAREAAARLLEQAGGAR